MRILQKLPVIGIIAKQICRNLTSARFTPSLWHSKTPPPYSTSRSAQTETNLVRKRTNLKLVMMKLTRPLTTTMQRNAAYAVRQRCKMPEWGRPCPVCYHDKQVIMYGSPCLPWAKKDVNRTSILKRNSSSTAQSKVKDSNSVSLHEAVEATCLKPELEPYKEVYESVYSSSNAQSSLGESFNVPCQPYKAAQKTCSKPQSEPRKEDCKGDPDKGTSPSSAEVTESHSIPFRPYKPYHMTCSKPQPKEDCERIPENMTSSNSEQPMVTKAHSVPLQLSKAVAVTCLKPEPQPCKEDYKSVHTSSSGQSSVVESGNVLCQPKKVSEMACSKPQSEPCEEDCKSVPEERNSPSSAEPVVAESQSVPFRPYKSFQLTCSHPQPTPCNEDEDFRFLTVIDICKTLAEKERLTPDPCKDLQKIEYAFDPSRELDQALVKSATLAAPLQRGPDIHSPLEAIDPCQRLDPVFVNSATLASPLKWDLFLTNCPLKAKDPCKKDPCKKDPCKTPPKKKDPCKKPPPKKKDPCKKDPCKKPKC